VATLQEIRRRIASTQNTHKITKAMEMVAAAKLRRAQQRIEALRPYAVSMIDMLQDVATFAQGTEGYALLRRHKTIKNVSLVVFTGDGGLAGAFNANVIRRAVELEHTARAEGREVRWLVVGRKGIGTLRFRGYQMDRTWTGLSDHPEFVNAEDIASTVIDLYSKEETDEVHLVYNRFRSPLEQTVEDVVRLPITLEEPAVARAEHKVRAAYEYEPYPRTVFEGLLPRYVEIAVFRSLLESSASEQGARMTAMRNASENAIELIDTYTLQLNRLRQASITQEILEVVAGANALG
jgi:F-type H+-transporting ATPase subunit gamma